MSAPNPNDPNQFLMSGGAGGKSAVFKHPGDAVVGTITSMRVVQQTDYKTKEPKFWKDGSPQNQLAVALQTTMRDPADQEDDGTRMVYLRYKSQEAVRDAVQASGASGLEIGGELQLAFTGVDTAYSGDGEPPKLYAAVYRPVAQVQLMGAATGVAAAQPAVGGYVSTSPYAQPVAPAPTQDAQAAAFATWQAQQQAAAAPPAPPAAPPVDPAYAAYLAAQQAAATPPPPPAAPPVDPAFAAWQAQQAAAAQAAAAPPAPPAAPAWTPPPGMDPAMAAALANMSPEMRATLQMPPA